MRPDLREETELTAIKAVAAASRTPFRTAFKATLGVAAAQLVIIVMFFGTLIVGATAIYLFAR